MAERGGHAPLHAMCATICLAKNPGPLVRFTFHWCPWQDLHLHWSAFEADVSALDYTGMKVNAPGRTRTDTEPGLSRLPLLNWATRAKLKVPMAGFAPALTSL